MIKLNTLEIVFRNYRLIFEEVPNFRRLVNKSLDWQEDLLHNHTPERGEYQRYPVVQYRAFQGNAALFGIGEGVPMLQKLILSSLLPEGLTSDVQLIRHSTEVDWLDTPKDYRLSHFLPLNSQNYEAWQTTDSYIERMVLLEKALTGHILNFCKDFAVDIPNKMLHVTLKNVKPLDSVVLTTGNGTMQMLCFDIEFQCNLLLPPLIGLGKGKSKGYGVMTYMGEKKQTGSETRSGTRLKNRNENLAKSPK